MTTPPPGFTVTRELGAGKVGPSALCRDGSGAEVVVTSLPVPSADDAARREFDSEVAAAGAAFDHPCAVSSTLVVEGERMWLRQPYLSGGALNGPVDADAATVGGARLAAVLGTGHAAGMLHGDVRPANVLLDGSGAWCLAGAGVAHAVKRIGVPVSPDPLFAAPEYFSGEQPGAAADVYSLGATLYAALAGTAPHAEAARAGAGALYAARLGPAPALPATVPAALAALVARMLAPDPADRPGLTEVDQVLRTLAPAGAVLPPPIPVREVPAPPRPAVRLAVTEPAVVAAASKRRTLVAAVAIGAVFLAGAGAVAATTSKDDGGVELAAGSEPTAATPTPTPTAAAPTPAAQLPAPAVTPAKAPAKSKQPKPSEPTSFAGVPLVLLKPTIQNLEADFYQGAWVLKVTFSAPSAPDFVKGWKLVARWPGGGVENLLNAKRGVAGTYFFHFTTEVPLTSCVKVVTNLGQADADDRLYASTEKCLSAAEVRAQQAKSKSLPAATAPTPTPAPKATKP